MGQEDESAGTSPCDGNLGGGTGRRTALLALQNALSLLCPGEEEEESCIAKASLHPPQLGGSKWEIKFGLWPTEEVCEPGAASMCSPLRSGPFFKVIASWGSVCSVLRELSSYCNSNPQQVDQTPKKSASV